MTMPRKALHNLDVFIYVLLILECLIVYLSNIVCYTLSHWVYEMRMFTVLPDGDGWEGVCSAYTQVIPWCFAFPSQSSRGHDVAVEWGDGGGGGWTWAQMGAPPVLCKGLNPTFVRATHHDRCPMASAPSDGSRVRQLHCPSLTQWELVVQRIKAQNCCALVHFRIKSWNLVHSCYI